MNEKRKQFHAGKLDEVAKYNWFYDEKERPWPNPIFQNIKTTPLSPEERFTTAMAPRKRLSTETSAAADASVKDNTHRKPQEPAAAATTDPPISPPKWGLILKLSLFAIPYFYLIFFHYNFDPEIRRSILINAATSLAGFFVTVKMIPVASRYVLRRNLFGYDINKKGTEQGTVKVWVFVFFLIFLSLYVWIKWCLVDFAFRSIFYITMRR